MLVGDLVKFFRDKFVGGKLTPGVLASSRIAFPLSLHGESLVWQPPSARISQSADQSLGTDMTQLDLGQLDWDSAEMWDSTAPKILTAPLAGIYYVFGQVQTNNTANVGMRLEVRVNSDSGVYQTKGEDTEVDGFNSLAAGWQVRLEVGDTLALYGETSGARTAAEDRCFLGATLIAPEP